MGWEEDPELGFGPAQEPEVAPEPSPPPAPPKRRIPVLYSPVVMTAQAMGKIGSVSMRSKPAYVHLPCFTC